MKVIRIYQYERCSTCKDALNFLAANRYAVEPVDIFAKPPSKADLKKMLEIQGGNIKRLLNVTGRVYQEMNLKEKIKTMTEDEVIDLLSRNGKLIKRPFLLMGTVGLIGFNKAEWKKALAEG